VNTFVEIAREEVAVRHFATSAQPPRATPVFSQNISSSHTLQPTRSFLLGDTPGALLEGLRCFPTACPLPLRLEGYGKPPTPQEINSGIKKIVLDVMAMLFRKHEVLTCKT
jgi:hypothetical protein